MLPRSVINEDPAMQKVAVELFNKRICRLCLCEVESLLDIDTVSEGCYFSFKMKIACCYSMATISSNAVPRFICRACADFVEKSYEFKNLCAKSELMLVKYNLSGTWDEALAIPKWLRSDNKQQDATEKRKSEPEQSDECSSAKKPKVVEQENNSGSTEKSQNIADSSQQSPKITPGNGNPFPQIPATITVEPIVDPIDSTISCQNAVQQPPATTSVPTSVVQFENVPLPSTNQNYLHPQQPIPVISNNLPNCQTGLTNYQLLPQQSQPYQGAMGQPINRPPMLPPQQLQPYQGSMGQPIHRLMLPSRQHQPYQGPISRPPLLPLPQLQSYLGPMGQPVNRPPQPYQGPMGQPINRQPMLSPQQTQQYQGSSMQPTTTISPQYSGSPNFSYHKPNTYINPQYSGNPSHSHQNPFGQHQYQPHPNVVPDQQPKPPSGDWCRVCPCRFTNPKHLRWHMRRHTSQRIKDYRDYLAKHPMATGCWLCLEDFDTQPQLVDHMERHTEVGTQHACDFCKLLFLSNEQWVVHVRENHAQEVEQTLNLNTR